MLSRLPSCGASSLVALLAAFAGGSWLHTREPVTLPNSNTAAIISFTIGLWRVCPHLERVNSTKDPECRWCLDDEETSSSRPQECPAIAMVRERHFGSSALNPEKVKIIQPRKL
ncbi:hypothetical protein NQ317_001672 [Molorchus minor]|uniref:Secreted protein n=1 Tax=Molorchus minor TaxID=1323400 RepID=A0ABQ9ISN1_9CUCU|nr:hypothetical protein NQ317_001672 [Molorchus minor]